MTAGGSAPPERGAALGAHARATAAAPPLPEADEPPSRSRWLLWLAGLAALIGLAYLATVRAATFEGGAEIRFAPDAEAVSLPNFDGGAHAVLYEHGGTVSFSFPLHNAGLVGLVVTGVRLSEDEPHPLLVVDQVTVNGDDLPARVGRGDTAQVEVTARYGNCRYYHERELDLLERAIVRVSVLGQSVTREVDFDHPLVVRSPMIVDCPDRTLTRDDDTRR